MKKLLLTAIVALAFCGSIFAQPTTHWPEYNSSIYMLNSPLVAFIQVNNEFVEATDSWDYMEIAAFVNGDCRGHMFMSDYTDDGDPHPCVELTIDYTDNGETVTFQLFDHENGILYEDCVSSIEIKTGDAHDEMYFDYDESVILYFTGGSTPPTPTFTKDITGVGEDGWNVGNGGYYLISSPLAGNTNPANVQNMINDDYDLYSFNQEGDNWLNYKNHTDEFTLQNEESYCRGYLYASKTDVTLTFTGTPVDYDEKTFDLEYAENNSILQGWNLIGNPFTEDAYIDRNFYVLNDDRNEIVPGNNNSPIPAMEGAFVYADNGEATVTMSTTPSNNKVARLNLNLSRERGVIDRAAVNFGEGSLPKFQLNPNHTKLYIPQDGTDYAVVSSEGMGEMPVNFKAEKSGTYTLSFNAEEVSFTYLHLIDNLTKNNVDLLASPSYTFDASITDNARRFTLVFATGNNNSENFAFFSNGEWIINNDGEATLQVVDALGRVLSSETISGSCSKAINAAAGVYMLRLVNGNNDVKVQKILVNN